MPPITGLPSRSPTTRPRQRAERADLQHARGYSPEAVQNKPSCDISSITAEGLAKPRARSRASDEAAKETLGSRVCSLGNKEVEIVPFSGATEPWSQWASHPCRSSVSASLLAMSHRRHLIEPGLRGGGVSGVHSKLEKLGS